MIRVAKVVTFILHPLVLIAPAVFFVIVASGHSYTDALFWTFVALFFTLSVIVYILFGMKKGFFSNFDVSRRSQRIYLFPFIIFVGLLFLLTLLVFRGPVSLFLAMVYFVVAVLILAFVNLKIKASIHVGSLTAILISGVYFFGNSFLPFLLFIPVMAWARVIEKRHTVRETVVGALMGSVLAFIGIIVVQYLL